MEIEKKVPVPESTLGIFKQMEIGDSFVCDPRKAQSMYSVAFYYRKQGHLTKSFKLKKKREGDKARVWRIK